ncbi:hypothetical protein KAX08_08610 [candidate division WOR-3 bacterium]|nr:hypothetical protein [candidate division WOR-3 bacterium]
MDITIGGYRFDGPYTSTDNLEGKSGIYAILCCFSDKCYIIDVGESVSVRLRVESCDRKDCWEKNCSDTLKFSVIIHLIYESLEEKR